MPKKLLKYPKIALINTRNDDFFGYKLVLDQEKIPYEIINTLVGEWDLVLLPKEHTVPIKFMLDYVRNGGSIVSSFEYNEPQPTIAGGMDSFQPYGDGVIYHFPFNFGEEILKPKYHSSTWKRNIFAQFVGYTQTSTSINNSKREYRIKFKNVLYRLVGPLTQIWYWPDNYLSCFCQRVDVDFPVSRVPFYQKNKIINKMFDLIKEFKGINFSLFLNHTFSQQNQEITSLCSNHKNTEIQSHGCDDNIKHRDYCYSLNLLTETEIEDMLSTSVSQQNAIIFAPPCEHVNKVVMDKCEKLGIQFITAGGISKDDIPRRCYFGGRSYNTYNIPTSQMEFVDNPSYNLDYYTKMFNASIKDNSLFCIYLHPNLLLNKEFNKLISQFLYYHVLSNQKRHSIWTPFMSELARWWALRDNIYIKDGKLIFKSKDSESSIKDKLSVVKWYPDHIKKII